MNQLEAIPHVPEADSFQFRASLDTIKQALFSHVWLVLATAVITTALVALYLWVWPPTYQAEVMISADSEKDSQKVAFYQGWNIFRRDGLTDEATMMTSPPALREVIKRLDLKYEDMYHPFTSYAIHLWGESWVGKNYRKVKKWFFPPAKSPFAATPEEIERGKALKDFQEGVSVRQVGDASIGLLIVKGSNEKVAKIANTLVDVYFEQRRARFVTEAEAAHASLLEEANKAAKELEVLDREMRDFRRESGLLLLYEKDRIQLGQWQTLRANVTDLEAAIADNESTLRTVKAQIAAESTSIGSDRMFQDVAMQDRLSKLEMNLAHTRQLFQPGAPEVRELEEQIAIARKTLESSKGNMIVRNPSRISDSYEALRTRQLGIESLLAGLRASHQSKKAELTRILAVVDKIPEKMQINQEFERKQFILESKYRGLNEKLAQASVSMATVKSAPQAMRVIEYAGAPEQPIWPKTKLLLLSAVGLGLLAGVLAALAIELAFMRVNRYRLYERDSEYRVFAVVDQDRRFLDGLYAGRPALEALPAGKT